MARTDHRLTFFLGLFAGFVLGSFAVVLINAPSGPKTPDAPDTYRAKYESEKVKYEAEKARRESVQDAFAEHLYGKK